MVVEDSEPLMDSWPDFKGVDIDTAIIVPCRNPQFRVCDVGCNLFACEFWVMFLEIITNRGKCSVCTKNV
jgi:hypothetical protein